MRDAKLASQCEARILYEVDLYLMAVFLSLSVELKSSKKHSPKRANSCVSNICTANMFKDGTMTNGLFGGGCE